MNKSTSIATELAAGIILDEWKRISNGAEKARDAGLGEIADLQAETASILARLFRELSGRYPHEARP